MAVRCQKARRGICLSSKEDENYESDIKDEIDPNQVSNNQNLLQL